MRQVNQPALRAVTTALNPLQIAIDTGTDDRGQQLFDALSATLAKCDTRITTRTPLQRDCPALSVSLPGKAMTGAATFYRFRALAPLRKAHASQLDVTIVADDSAHFASEQTRINTASLGEHAIEMACRYAVQRGRKRVSLLTHDEMSPATQTFTHRLIDDVSGRYPTLELQAMGADEALFAMFKNAAELDVIVTSPAIAQTLCAAAVNLASAAATATVMRVRDQQCDVLPWSVIKGHDTPTSLSVWLQCATECLLMLGRARQALELDNAWLATLEHGAHCDSVQLISPYTTTLPTDAFAQAVCARLGEAPSKVQQRLAPGATTPPQRLTLVPNTH